MNLQTMMQGVAAKMRADFGQLSTQFRHPGELGTRREHIVRDFLREHLPPNLDVVSGELFARDDRSCHCDLIVIDRMKVPTLATGTTRLIPVEGAYAVIEVKSNLDGPALRSCLRKCDTVKGMRRDADAGVPSDAAPGFILAEQPLRSFPLMYSVFAHTAISPDTLAKAALDHWNSTGTPHLIDSVLCSDKWVMCWGRTEGGVTWLEPGRGPGFPDLDLVEAGANALLAFYLLNYKWLSQAACDPIDMLRYSGVGSFGPTRTLARTAPASRPRGKG